MDGVLIVDKPQGLTSHDVVAVARRRLQESRIGHTGTLDPLATGVLPLACGRATRLVRFLSATDKDYDAGISFGFTTDSYDVTGRETGRSDRIPNREAIESALAPLRGDYLQQPPPYSAKKIGGERAYTRARRDQEVTLAPAPVRVTRAELLAFAEGTAHIGLTCSAGFYVRSFAQSLGELVGTGACLASLRRTRSGEFSLVDAVSMSELAEPASGMAVGRAIIPMERLLPRMPAVRVDAVGRIRVSHGQALNSSQFRYLEGAAQAPRARPGEDMWVRIVSEEGELLAIGSPGTTPGSVHPSIVLA